MTQQETRTAERIRQLAIREIQSAQNYDDSENTEKRDKSLRFYNGTQTSRELPSQPNRSKVKTTHTRDTINYMMPQIMKVFFSGSEVVRVSPSGAPAMDPMEMQQIAQQIVQGGEQPTEDSIKQHFIDRDKEEAKEATLYLNHLFMVAHDGYRIGWDVIQDALIVGNGIIKSFWDDKAEYETEDLTGLSDDEYFALEADDDAEITNHTETTEPIEVGVTDEIGNVIGAELQEQTTHDVKVRRVVTEGRVSFVEVAPEDFLIDSRATCIEDARFVAHRSPNTTRSDLVAMGYNKSDIASLPTGNGDSDDLADDARGSSDIEDYTDDAADVSMEIVEYHECYCRVDVDDDGMAETVRACIGGGENGKLLYWEVLSDEEFPFADFNPERMAHRFRGVSVPDKTIEKDQVGTAVYRQVMDNLYAANSPQREIEEGSVINSEALISNAFGAIIWKKAGSSPIQPSITPFVAAESMPMLAYIDDLVTRATGVDRNSAAVNPEALNNQSATSANIAQSMAYSRIELVARNFAKGGFNQLFNRLLKLARKHQQYGTAVDDGGTPREVNPGDWRTEMGITVNVGLGSGSQEKDALAIRQVLMAQADIIDRFQGAGMAEQAMDMVPKYIAANERMAEINGLEAASQYFPDIDQADVDELKQAQAEQEAQQPQEDPEITLKREKMQADIALEQEKMQADFKLRETEMLMEFELAKAKAMMTGELTSADANIRRT